MIRVHALQNPFSSTIYQCEVKPGLSAAAIVQRLWEDLGWQPGETIVGATSAGRLDAQQIHEPLEDGTDLVLFPSPGGITVGAVIVQIIIAVVIAAIAYALAPKPKDAPQDRGEDTSPTYQFEIATEYRAGLVIPVVLGRHDVGGTMISTQVRSLTATSGPSRMGVEHVFAILALAQGPINRIGGTWGDQDRLGGISGMFPKGGTLPSDIRVNGNRMDPTATWPGIVAYTRTGSLNQTAIPDFPANASTTELVNEFLNNKGDQHIYTITNASGLPIATMQFILFFPGGCYYLDGNAQAQKFVCKVIPEFRPVGSVNWRRLFPGPEPEIDIGLYNSARTRQPFAVTLEGNLNPPVETAIEVRIRRTTAPNEGGLGNAVSSLKWRQVVYQIAEELQYPGMALEGLILETGESIGGSRANYVNRIEGSTVRVWDRNVNQGLPSGFWEDGEMIPQIGEVYGWYWDVIPVAWSYGGIWTYPPGMNPAWQAVELLTNQHWGLGRWISDDHIDWQAFRDWADWCDRDVLTGAVNEAGNQCNLVLDSATPAWEALIRICSAGRAVPCLLGNKYSVRYNYDAAHGRGTNSIPQKSAVQLFSDANTEGLQVRFLNPRARPAVYLLQILNEEKDFIHETIPVEDPDGEFNDPASPTAIEFRKETRDAFGITRRSQAIREALFDHKANSLIKSEVTFLAGPEALAATLGDLILVQHHWLRPYDTDADGWRAYQASSGNIVYLDHQIVLVASKQYQIAYRGKNGSIGTALVAAATAGTFAIGSSIPLQSVVNIDKGAPVVFGEENAITKTYEIRDISLTQELKRKVVAHEHHAAVHADPNVGADLEFGGDEDDESLFVPEQSRQYNTNDQDFPTPLGIQVRKTKNAGEHEVSIVGDPSYTIRPCRIFSRVAGEAVSDAEQARLFGAEAYAAIGMEDGSPPTTVAVGWSLLGETLAGAPLLTHGLLSTESYDFAVVQPSLLGAWPPPDTGEIIEDVAVDEFPVDRPHPPTHLYVQQVFEGNLLQWEQAEGAEVAYYEIRETDATTVRWLGAQVVGRTTQQMIELPPATGTLYAVRARSRWGQWSDLATIAAPGAPENETDSGAVFAVPSTVNLDGGGGYSLSSGKWYGTATSTISLGYTAEARLLLSVHTYWEDITTTLEDLDFTMDSGEACWWMLEGREASLERPGCIFEMGLDDAEFVGKTLEDPIFDGMGVGGTKGQAGEHAAVRIFVNYDAGGWEPYTPRRRVFNSAQVQLRFYRESEQYQAYSGTLSAKIYLR